MSAPLPITESDLHAWIDGQLPPERAREVEAYLASHPEDLRRAEAWRAQKQELKGLFDPVQDEPIPAQLLREARPRRPWWAERLAAGVVIALVSGAAGWGLRGESAARLAAGTAPAPGVVQVSAFAQRAAIAHAVFTPDERRPVEVDAAHEDQLVTWLSRRMGTPMRPPHLQEQGYTLEGGRLLPGGKGPVAQFMYRDPAGRRLTLYVSNQLGDVAEARGPASRPANADTAFRFAREGEVNVFYWVDGPFGYALSTEADKGELGRVSGEVYRQLAAHR